MNMNTNKSRRPKANPPPPPKTHTHYLEERVADLEAKVAVLVLDYDNRNSRKS
jgi:hypothetical protein